MTGPAPSGARGHAAVAVALLVLGFLAFGNALGNGFVLDDQERLVRNPAVLELQPLSRYLLDPSTQALDPGLHAYRPLLPLTLAWNVAATGLDPTGIRLVNVLLQVVCAFLAYLVFLELFAVVRVEDPPGREAAFLAAALFAVHPVSGIPVNYVTTRDLVLALGFTLAALRVELRRRREAGARPAWAALGLLGMGYLAKLNAAAFAAMVWWAGVTLEGASPADRRVALRALPYGLLPVLFLAGVPLLTGFSETSTTTTGVTVASVTATQAVAHVFHYLRDFFWPFAMRMAPDLDWIGWGDPRALAAGVVLAGVLATAWRARRSRPLVAFGIGCYFLMLAPTSSVVAMIHPVVPYRPYPGAPFLLLALVVGGRAALRPELRRPVGAAVLLATLGASVRMNGVWRDSRALWTHSLRHGGNGFAMLSMASVVEDPATKRELLRVALLRYPKSRLVRRRVAALWLGEGKVEAATALLAEARAATDPELRNLWAVAVALAGGATQGAPGPGTPQEREELLQIGREGLVGGHPEVARAALTRLVAAAARYRGALLLRGIAELRSGDPATATRTFGEVLSRLDAGEDLNAEALQPLDPAALRAQALLQRALAHEALADCAAALRDAARVLADPEAAALRERCSATERGPVPAAEEEKGAPRLPKVGGSREAGAEGHDVSVGR